MDKVLLKQADVLRMGVSKWLLLRLVRSGALRKVVPKGGRYGYFVRGEVERALMGKAESRKQKAEIGTGLGIGKKTEVGGRMAKGMGSI